MWYLYHSILRSALIDREVLIIVQVHTPRSSQFNDTLRDQVSQTISTFGEAQLPVSVRLSKTYNSNISHIGYPN